MTPNSSLVTAATRAQAHTSPRKPPTSAPWLRRPGNKRRRAAASLGIVPRGLLVVFGGPLAAGCQPLADRCLRDTRRAGDAVLAPTFGTPLKGALASPLTPWQRGCLGCSLHRQG